MLLEKISFNILFLHFKTFGHVQLDYFSYDDIEY